MGFVHGGDAMAKPTKFEPARNGVNQTRKTAKGNIIHRQVAPDGKTTDHLCRKDGTVERLVTETKEPQ